MKEKISLLLTKHKPLVALVIAGLLFILICFCIYLFLKKPECSAQINGKHYSCAFGRSGLVAAHRKREGDGATPEGEYALGNEIWYRPDHVHPSEITSVLNKRPIEPNDGWCDDASKPEYNQYVKLPFKGSHEKLWFPEGDPRYDILMVIQYNTKPAVPGKGSAIFLHIAGKDEKGHRMATSGCIAFSKKDFIEILKHIGPETKIRISKRAGISFMNPVKAPSSTQKSL